MPCSICLSTEETVIFYRGVGLLGKHERLCLICAVYQSYGLMRHVLEPGAVLVLTDVNTPKNGEDFLRD